MFATPPALSQASAPALEPLNGPEESVMRAIGRMIVVLPRALDADLRREQRMSLSEYTVLRILSETPGRQMRMSELAVACNMSLSGMTRLATRHESLGYLRREPSANDARGLNAVLTDAGLARLREAWPTHLASVRRQIFDHLGEIDLCKLATALSAMAADTP